MRFLIACVLCTSLPVDDHVFRVEICRILDISLVHYCRSPLQRLWCACARCGDPLIQLLLPNNKSPTVAVFVSVHCRRQWCLPRVPYARWHLCLVFLNIYICIMHITRLHYLCFKTNFFPLGKTNPRVVFNISNVFLSRMLILYAAIQHNRLLGIVHKSKTHHWYALSTQKPIHKKIAMLKFNFLKKNKE